MRRVARYLWTPVNERRIVLWCLQLTACFYLVLFFLGRIK